MIASKLGLFLVGGGLIGTSVTGIYLANKNSAPAIALQEQRDHT
ncbi:hypothetical protein OVS_03670 [Mycoplasma ovis str. Michigan]|uniref:Uncharacterized protein n=1 Tax=Mycoplasma ovis str. Michigan TaxID=1415773 RepID=A0ABN4BNN2_9MOLU|nr:hypothetical protein [Mycoplasma ovis]AHC40482.1 hypothetical protein OVS_03670 [Mycoplasma ovis str. Michigan]